MASISAFSSSPQTAYVHCIYLFISLRLIAVLDTFFLQNYSLFQDLFSVQHNVWSVFEARSGPLRFSRSFESWSQGRSRGRQPEPER
jgi:hypothetical protein